MIVRCFTGDDGQSHFEELNMPAGDLEQVVLKAGEDMIFKRVPAGFFNDWHNVPFRFYNIILEGHMEYQIGDGTFHRFGPGDVIQWEDQTGQGHTSRVVEGGPRLAISLRLPD